MLKLNDAQRKELIESYRKMRGNVETVGEVIMNDEEDQQKPRIYFSHNWELIEAKLAERITQLSYFSLNKMAREGKILRIKKLGKIYFLKNECQKIAIERDFGRHKKKLLEKER